MVAKSPESQTTVVPVAFNCSNEEVMFAVEDVMIFQVMVMWMRGKVKFRPVVVSSDASAPPQD